MKLFCFCFLNLLLLLVVLFTLPATSEQRRHHRHRHHHHHRHHHQLEEEEFERAEERNEFEDDSENENEEEEEEDELGDEFSEMAFPGAHKKRSANGQSFFSIPLKKADITSEHHRNLVAYQKRDVGNDIVNSNYNLPLEGDVDRFGIFYVEVGVGTPPRNFKVIFDTGGWNLLLINRNCTNCGEVRHYRPSLSTSQKRLWCNELRICRCSKTNKCLSHHHFGGGQDFIAQVYEDVVHFANLQTKAYLSAIKVKTTSKFAFPPGIDGLMGFGYYSTTSHPTVFQRLVNSGMVKDVFSTCLGRNGGVLTLGGIDPHLYRKGSQIQWSPLKKKRWYVVTVMDMDVNGKSLGLPPSAYAERHAIVDSGTTFLYVPEAAFEKILDFLDKSCSKVKIPGVCDGKMQDLMRCGRGVWMTPEERDLFPNITITLQNNVKLDVPSHLYMYPTEPILSRGSKTKYCMSVQQSRDKKEVVIGSVVLQQYYTIYDRGNARVGFAPVENCF